MVSEDPERQAFRQKPNRGNLFAALQDGSGTVVHAEVLDLSASGIHGCLPGHVVAPTAGLPLTVTLAYGEKSIQTISLKAIVVERDMPPGEFAAAWELDLNTAADRAAERILGSWIAAWQREEITARVTKRRPSVEDRRAPEAEEGA